MYNLAVLFLQYDTDKYRNAFDNMQKYLKKIDCHKKIFVIDNKKTDDCVKVDDDVITICGDNSCWEFSGWDKGVRFLNNCNIDYDAILFINDSFENSIDGGTPDTIINDTQLKRCIDENIPIQAVVNTCNKDYFIINGESTDIRGRSHCFMLSKTTVAKLGSLTTLDVNFIDKCINPEISRPRFRVDSPINENLKVFIEQWLGGYWHSAFRFEDNWYLFRMKSLAFMNELMLAKRIKDLELDYEYQIDNADVVVFDVFDTAIFRKFKFPDRVQYHMGGGFWQDRKKAEEKALKENINCNLTDIYRIGNLPCEKISQEINLEEAVCYQNPEIFKYYEYAYLKGKEIVFLSDMYLPTSVIKRMLMKCGYKNHKVLVSNEINARKDNGQSYVYLKSQFKDTKKILMIGDNYHSDYKMAKQSGIKAIHYQKKSDEKDYWYKIGYNAVGAMALGYVLWLKEQFKVKGINKSYFFSREGQLFYDIYNLIKDKEDPDGQMLYLSRKSLNIPLLADIPPEVFFDSPMYQSLRWHLTFTVTAGNADEYCKFFGISPPCKLDKKDWKELSFAKREQEQLKTLKLIYPLVQKKAKELRVNLKMYLHNNADFSHKKIALVDLGYGGSIQESFIKFVEKHSIHNPEFECFLLAPDKRLEERHDKYSYNCMLEVDNPTFIKNIYMMECLFNAPYGSCLEYDSKGNPIFDAEDCLYCADIHRGAMDFVIDSKYMTVNNFTKLGLSNLSNLVNSVNPEDARYIGGLKLYSSGTSGFYENIAKPDFSFLKEQREKARNKRMFDVNVREMFKEWENVY